MDCVSGLTAADVIIRMLFQFCFSEMKLVSAEEKGG